HRIRSHILTEARICRTPSPATSKPATTAKSTTRAEYGILRKVNRQFLPIKSISNGTLQIADRPPQNGTAREKLRRVFHRDRSRQSVLRHERGRRSIRDQRAALLHELRQLGQPVH